MKNFFDKYRAITQLIIMASLFVSCDTNDVPTGEKWEDGRARIELFTRAYSYNLPQTRSLANENGLNKTPWVLVFKKDASNNFIFEEAVQAIEFSGVDKRFVDLKTQTNDCKVLVLANTQSSFFIKGDPTPHNFSIAEFENLLASKKIEEAADILYTQPLNNPETSIPYSNNSLIPMSYVLELNGGINSTTEIGSITNPLELERIVAKIVVKNTDPKFTFKGITTVVNAPEEGALHRISGLLPANNNSQDLVEYRTDNAYSSEIAGAITESTVTNPIYLYESKSGTASDTYLIIKGEYAGVDYYYKVLLIDKNLNPLDMLRNHLYAFTITNVNGRGYDTVEDAKKSSTVLNYTITVTDDFSYEIIANDDYYLAVTNSIFIAYTDIDETYTASTLATDCNIEFIDRTVEVYDDRGNFSLNSSDEIPIVINGVTSNPVTDDIEVKISGNLNHPWGGVLLTLGNIEKKISIRRNNAVPAVGGFLEIGAPDTETDQNRWPYYYTSGYVVENSAKNWVKLISSTGEERNDSSSMIVSDGVIKVKVEANTSGSPRRGSVILSAMGEGNPNDYKSFRIKVDITQKAN